MSRARTRFQASRNKQLISSLRANDGARGDLRGVYGDDGDVSDVVHVRADEHDWDLYGMMNAAEAEERGLKRKFL